MDEEERTALEMTKDELLARGERGVPIEGARTKPNTRNREDFAQRMHRVVAETTERSEREEPTVIVIKPNFFSVTRESLEPPAPQTEPPGSDRQTRAEFHTVPAH